MRTPHQFRRITQRTGQIVSFQNLHDLLGRLHSSPPRELNNGWRRSAHPRRDPAPCRRAGRTTSQMGRSRDRQRAVFMTASGHLYGRHWAVFRGRRHRRDLDCEPQQARGIPRNLQVDETDEELSRPVELCEVQTCLATYAAMSGFRFRVAVGAGSA